MPIQNYGVLKVYPRSRVQGTMGSPHYQILAVDDNQTQYRIAVNVKSQEEPSALLYLHIPNFHHPITDQLNAQLSSGFTALASTAGGLAIDFQRSDLVNQEHLPANQIKQLFSIEAEDALNTLLDAQLLQAIEQQNQSTVIYAFGSRWSEPGKADQVFGFEPGNGIHNIHMNQGNNSGHFDEDGTWQDGALLIYQSATQQWNATFLLFQSQQLPTDDNGHAL